MVLSCLATVSGAFETISACFVDEYPRLRQYKPAIAFSALVIAFLVNLALATQVIKIKCKLEQGPNDHSYLCNDTILK